MTWLYIPNIEPLHSAPEPEGSNLASSLPDPERAASLTWRGKHMRPAHWSRAWKRDSWLRRLSGLTSPPSTLDRGVAAFIASLPEIHASPTASPESAYSAAGQRAIPAPEVVGIADESGADRIFRENVTGNAARQLDAIVPALERLGYRIAAGIFRVSDVGGSHLRERLIIMADRIGGGQPQHAQFDGRSIRAGQTLPGRRHALRRDHNALELANAVRAGSPSIARDDGQVRGLPKAQRKPEHGSALPGRGGGFIPVLCPGPSDARWPDIIARAPHLEPAIRRMADGLANRVDRLRLCGNGVHPLAAGYAWLALDALLADAAASDAAVRSAA
jgi:DNA (cytosine-5)-methyltransferase 1